MRESKQSAQADEARKRFFVSGPPTGIRGMGSQYHPSGGSSLQPTLGRSGTYREPIKVEIERTRYEKEKTAERWKSTGPKELENEQNKKESRICSGKRGRGGRAGGMSVDGTCWNLWYMLESHSLLQRAHFFRTCVMLLHKQSQGYEALTHIS